MTAPDAAGADPLADSDYRRDLGDGLILRWSQPEAVARVAAVVSEVFGSAERPSEADRKSVLQSFRANYPHGGPNDWAIVEHLPTGRLVSATALMNQTWTYDGIPFGVGRPEQVVTRRPYRDRGLVRAIFDLVNPSRRPYAWYVRVPDLAAFVTRIAPALERRLDRSDFAGQSFALGISLYRGLLTISFKDGRFVSVEEQPSRRGLLPGETNGAGAAMPRGQLI